MHYKYPPLGTKLPPAENTMEPAKDPFDQGYVERFKQATAQQEALNYTNSAILAYNNPGEGDDPPSGTFQTWLASYSIGRVRGPEGMGDPDAPPPTPPNGYMAVLVFNDDSNTNEWAIEQVGPPACEIPAYDKIPAPQHYKG